VGDSNKFHFAWFNEALGQHERETGHLAARRALGRPRALWGFAAPARDPSLAWLQTALGREGTTLEMFDMHPNDPTVHDLDINALDAPWSRSCAARASHRRARASSPGCTGCYARVGSR
jgi:hypothetical protein